MIIKISDRIAECTNSIKNMNSEVQEYNIIIMCLKSLQMVEMYPDKFKYTQEDFDKVLNKLHNLCAKHEISIPDDVDWKSIEIR